MNQDHSTSICWERTGAWLGGSVTAVTFSPDFVADQIVLAATAAGIYRSTNGGLQWQLSNRGLTDPNVLALLFAPANRGLEKVAFASTETGRLFTSLDGGQQWQEVNAWAGLGVGRALAISPNYVEDRTLFVATGEGVLRSQDGGKTWESSTFGLLDLDVLCVACTPDYVQRETLWAGTALGGLYRSRNAARSWRDAGMGLPESAIQCLCISPNFATDQTLWVGTETAGVYISTNGGESWASCSPTIANECINCLTITPTGALLAGTGAGIFGSHDAGRSWRTRGEDTQAGAFLALSLAVAPTGVILAGAYQEGIFCSLDDGQQWQQAIAGLAAHVPPLTAMSAQGMLFALDVQGELALSVDAGASWQNINPDPALPPIQAMAMSQHEVNPTFYAASGAELWRATLTDTEVKWQAQPSPLALGQTAGLLAFSPHFSQDQTVLLSDSASTLYLSTDSGMSWRVLPAPWANEQLLSAALTPWQPTTPGIDVVTAALDAYGNYRVQLWHTSSTTASWEVLATLHTETPAVAYSLLPDPTQSIRLLGTRNRIIKLFTSPVTGELAVAQTFLADDLQITAFASAPDSNSMICVATTGGVFISADQGANWHPLGEERMQRPVVSIFPQMSDGRVFIVTLGGDVWVSRQSHSK